MAAQITNPKELVTNPKPQTRSQASKVVAEKAQAIVEQRVPAPGVAPIQPKKKGGKGAKKTGTHQGDQETQQLATLYESGGQVEVAEVETYKPGEPLVRLHPGSQLSKERGYPAAALHKHYMDNFKKPVSEQKGGIMAKVKPEVFHHDLLDGQFMVEDRKSVV